MSPIDQAQSTGRTGRWASGLLVGLVGLSIYLLTLSLGLTWAHDSGDG